MKHENSRLWWINSVNQYSEQKYLIYYIPYVNSFAVASDFQFQTNKARFKGSSWQNSASTVKSETSEIEREVKWRGINYQSCLSGTAVEISRSSFQS